MNFIAVMSALAVATLASPATAEEFFQQRGGWDVFDLNEETCAMQMEYEGPGATRVLYAKAIDGRKVLIVSNTNWSARQGESYDVNYYVDEFSYGGNAQGISTPGRNGFGLRFEETDFEQRFIAGKDLWIYLGEQKIDHLSLAGTAVGVAAIDRCLVGVRRTAAAVAAEKARWQDLPRDPFADARKSGSETVSRDGPSQARPALPLNPDRWAARILQNYPYAALRAREEGTVVMAIGVMPSGRISSCTVTESSGSAALDDAACRGMERYARYIPALNDAGVPVSAATSATLRFSLPEPTAPEDSWGT